MSVEEKTSHRTTTTFRCRGARNDKEEVTAIVLINEPPKYSRMRGVEDGDVRVICPRFVGYREVKEYHSGCWQGSLPDIETLQPYDQAVQQKNVIRCPYFRQRKDD